MNTIKEILALPDPNDRKTALISYAAALNIKLSKDRLSSGGYNEEQLVIAIVKEEKRRKKNFVINTKFMFFLVAITVVVLAFITMLPGLRAKISDTAETFSENDIGKNEPKVFKIIDGSYKEYNKRGDLETEYYYQNGKLIWWKEYDLRGNVIAEHKK